MKGVGRGASCGDGLGRGASLGDGEERVAR